LKLGILDAGISMASPVLGLRPARASLLRTRKVPNPTKVI